MRDGQVVSSLDASATLNQVPVVSVDHVFAERSVLSKGNQWLKANRANIIKPKREADHG